MRTRANPRVPKWFDEGCATFFESWDLDRKNEENILSGLDGDYARGISLTYPAMDGPPPLAAYWIPPEKLLLLDHVSPPILTLWVGNDAESQFASRMPRLQEYNEAWCAMTFLIHNKKGQEVFKKLVNAFREGDDLGKVRKKYYSETFLASFQDEWFKFIESEILPRWKLPTVGGGTFPRGLKAAPPEGTSGFGLTKDNRSDMFLVKAEERRVRLQAGEQRVWMLEAWSVPRRFYEEAWELVPSVVKAEPVPFVGGLYLPVLFSDPGSDFKAVFLQPVFSSLSKKDKDRLSSRLTEAAIGLIFQRRG
jgi:hypothetical protein